MTMRFKRSLIGYKPKQVDQLLDSYERDFSTRLNEAESEYNRLVSEADELKAKISIAKERLEKIKKLDEEVKDTLLNVFIDSSNTVNEASVKADNEIENMKCILLKYEEEYNRLNELNKKMMNDLKSRMDLYKEKLGALDNER